MLRSLLLSRVGRLLSNESVCEVMQSCFRIFFETRLSELLRRQAQATLSDMIFHLFSNLSQLKVGSSLYPSQPACVSLSGSISIFVSVTVVVSLRTETDSLVSHRF